TSATPLSAALRQSRRLPAHPFSGRRGRNVARRFGSHGGRPEGGGGRGNHRGLAQGLARLAAQRRHAARGAGSDRAYRALRQTAHSLKKEPRRWGSGGVKRPLQERVGDHRTSLRGGMKSGRGNLYVRPIGQTMRATPEVCTIRAKV